MVEPRSLDIANALAVRIGRRIFRLVINLSGALLVVALILVPVSYALDAQHHVATVRSGVHIAVGRGLISLFNDADYGPYAGSIVAVSGPGPSRVRRRGFDAPGVYYRWFRFSDGRTLWTLSGSPLVLAVLGGVFPLIDVVRDALPRVMSRAGGRGP